MIYSPITEVKVKCKCGWIGTIWNCDPDVDGDGSLGCPECLEIIEVIIPRIDKDDFHEISNNL